MTWPLKLLRALGLIFWRVIFRLWLSLKKAKYILRLLISTWTKIHQTKSLFDWCGAELVKRVSKIVKTGFTKSRINSMQWFGCKACLLVIKRIAPSTNFTKKTPRNTIFHCFYGKETPRPIFADYVDFRCRHFIILARAWRYISLFLACFLV